MTGPKLEPGDPVALKLARESKLPMTIITAFLFGERWKYTAHDRHHHYWTDFEDNFVKLPYVGTPMKPPVAGARHNPGRPTAFVIGTLVDAKSHMLQGSPMNYGTAWNSKLWETPITNAALKAATAGFMLNFPGVTRFMGHGFSDGAGI